MKKLLASTILAAGLHGFAGPAEAAACGKVSIAEMNWASVGVAAHVDKLILEKGYGCTVTLVAGDTMPTFTSMNEKGEPDVAPEMWVNAVRKPLDAAIAEGRLLQLAPLLPDGGVEGWWIPKFVADEHPDIRTVQDALKHPELFPAPEDPSKAAVHNCPSGWNCQVSTANLYKAIEAEKAGFELVDTGSAAGLDGSIANAFEKKTGWLGYYWAPTAILGKYEMVKLDAGVAHDAKSWIRCNTSADCANPPKNDWAKADVMTVVTDRFKKAGGDAYNYLNTRNWGNDTVNELLAWMQENQANGEDGAHHFLKNYPQIWSEWVTPEVAERVKAAL